MAESEEGQKSKTNVEGLCLGAKGFQRILDFVEFSEDRFIEASLQDANIRYQSVQFRVKTKKKLREKYLDANRNYQRLEDITDLAGLRVITYYEDDIDRVAKVIGREFDLDSENCVDRRDTEPDRFGYSALNYVCTHLAKRTADVEYKRFAGIRCEVQITSILMHAWSEIEHEWYDLKGAYPNKIKRRFYRIAALLELAESEFLSLRKEQSDYQRSVAVQVEARVPDLAVDVVSLKSFVEQEPLVANIDESVARILRVLLLGQLPDAAAEIRARAANTAGMKTLENIRDLLARHKAAIPEFALRCRRELWPDLVTAAFLYKGICIFHLSRLLASIQGEEATAEFLKLYGPDRKVDIGRQVAIAREIVARYSN